jgi:hypothetical protein
LSKLSLSGDGVVDAGGITWAIEITGLIISPAKNKQKMNLECCIDQATSECCLSLQVKLEPHLWLYGQ